MDGFDLAPARAAATRLVRRRERFRDDALVTELDHAREKSLRLARVSGDDAIDDLGSGGETLERRATLYVRPVEQIDAVEVEHVEEEDRRPLRRWRRRVGRVPRETRR